MGSLEVGLQGLLGLGLSWGCWVKSGFCDFRCQVMGSGGGWGGGLRVLGLRV